MDMLLQSFEEHTVIWILISAGLGGLIGALIKFVFEQVFTPKLQSSRMAKIAIRRYSLPLLRAADTLDRRIENLLKFVDKQWFDDANDDYYRLSTLYLFGSYFGWCKILENEAFIEFEISHKKSREFNKCFYRAFKGITGFYYFKDLEAKEMSSVEKATVPRLALTAIGELMIKNPERNKDKSSKVIDFIEFTQKYKNSPDFKKWFSYLENILSELRKSNTNARWNRLVVFAINLRLFVSHLDPLGKHTKPRKIYYIKHLHQKVAKRIHDELVESGQSELIEE